MIAVLAGFLSTVLVGCSVQISRPAADIELEGTWTHEDDDRVTAVTFAANGDVTFFNLPDAVVADSRGVPAPENVDWRQTQDYGGCWYIPDEPRPETGDHWFRVDLHAIGDTSRPRDDGRMYVTDADTLYLFWGEPADRQRFTFQRPDEALPKSSPGPTTEAPQCDDPYREVK